MLFIERDVSIHISDDLVLKVLHFLKTGIERIDLFGKTAVLPLRNLHQFDPGIVWEVPLHNITSLVSRAIIHDHPFLRKHCLLNHRLNGFLNEYRFVSSRSNQHILQLCVVAFIHHYPLNLVMEMIAPIALYLSAATLDRPTPTTNDRSFANR